jgi:hypothetical protein
VNDAMHLSARSIANAVPMSRLLAHLGFLVNERTHRSACALHRGTNPTAFSWTEDGFWHCFRCEQSGDKYDLVQAALNCDFREALKVMAVLAGLDLEMVSPAQRRRIRAQQRWERQLDIATERYVHLERRLICDHAHRLRLLDKIEALAAFCLQDSLRSGLDSQPDFWWDALARVYAERWNALAAWLLVAFGTEDERQRFVLYPGERPALLRGVFDAGGVATDHGFWRELRGVV